MKQRQAVERVYARLKGQRALNKIRTRGVQKVTAHCYLSLIVLQASTQANLACYNNHRSIGGYYDATKTEKERADRPSGCV